MENILQSLTSDAIATQGLDIGQRVRIANGKTGIIRHVGACHWAPGDFVGIELDSAHGKHDGTVDNVTYFITKPKHALFVRPTDIDRMVPTSSSSLLSGGSDGQNIHVSTISSSVQSSGSPSSHTGSSSVSSRMNNSTKMNNINVSKARSSIVRTTPYIGPSSNSSSTTASLISQQKGLTGSMWSRSRQLEKIGHQIPISSSSSSSYSSPPSSSSSSTKDYIIDNGNSSNNSNNAGMTDDVVSLERQIAILQQKLLQAQMQSSVHTSSSSPPVTTSSVDVPRPSSSSSSSLTTASSSPAVTVSAARSSAAVARSRGAHISPSLSTKRSPLSTVSQGKPSPTGSIHSTSSRHTALTEILDLDIHHQQHTTTSPLTNNSNRSSSVVARKVGLGTSSVPSSHTSGSAPLRGIIAPKPINNVTPPPPPPQLTKDTDRKYSTNHTEELPKTVQEPSPIRKLSPDITDINETQTEADIQKETNGYSENKGNHYSNEETHETTDSTLSALLVKVTEHAPSTSSTTEGRESYPSITEVRENSLPSVSSNDTATDDNFGSFSLPSSNVLPTEVTFTATLSNTSKVIRPMGIARKLAQASLQGTNGTGTMGITARATTTMNKVTGLVSSSRSSSPSGGKKSGNLTSNNNKSIMATPSSVVSKPSSNDNPLLTSLGNSESRLSIASSGSTNNQSKVIIPSNRRAFTYGYGVSKRKEALLNISSGGGSTVITSNDDKHAVNISISSLPSTDNAVNDSQGNITLNDLNSNHTTPAQVSGMRAYVLNNSGTNSSINGSPFTANVSSSSGNETRVSLSVPPSEDSNKKPASKPAPGSARSKLLSHAAMAKLNPSKPPTVSTTITTTSATASSPSISVPKNRSSSSPRSRPLPTVGQFTAGMKSPSSSSSTTRGRSDSVNSSASQSTDLHNRDKTKLSSPRSRAMSVGRSSRTGPGSLLTSPTASKTRLRPTGVGSSPMNELKVLTKGTVSNPYIDSITSTQSPTKSTKVPTHQHSLPRTPPTVVVHTSEAASVLPTLIGSGTAVLSTRTGTLSPGRQRGDSINESSSLLSEDETIKSIDHPMHADEDVVSALVRSRLMSARHRRSNDGLYTGDGDKDTDTGVALTNEKWQHGLRQPQPLSPITKSMSVSPRSSTPTRTKHTVTEDQGPELYSGRKLSTAQFLKLSKATNLITSSASRSSPPKNLVRTGLMSPVTVDKPRGHVLGTVGMNIEPISLTFPSYSSTIGTSNKSNNDMVIDDDLTVDTTNQGSTLPPNAEAEEIMNRLRSKYGQGSLLHSLTNKVLSIDTDSLYVDNATEITTTDGTNIAKSTASSIASIAASAAAITAAGIVARSTQNSMLSKGVPQPQSLHHHLFSPTLDNFAHYMPITPSVTNRKLLPSPQRNRSLSPSSLAKVSPSKAKLLSPSSKQRAYSPSSALASVFSNTGTNRSLSPLSKNEKTSEFDSRDAATVAAAAAAMATMAIVAKTVQATADGLVQASKQQQQQSQQSIVPSSKGPKRRPPPPPVPVLPPLLGPSSGNKASTSTTITTKPVDNTTTVSSCSANNSITLPPPSLVLSIPPVTSNTYSPPSSPILDGNVRPTVPINRPPTPPRPASPVQRPPSTPNGSNNAEGLPPLPVPPMLSQLSKTSMTVKITTINTSTTDSNGTDDEDNTLVFSEETAPITTKEAFVINPSPTVPPHKPTTLEPEVPLTDTVLPTVDTPREIAPSPPSEQPPVLENIEIISTKSNDTIIDENKMNSETEMVTVPQINVVKSYAGICEQGYNPSIPDKPCQDAIIMVEHPPTDSVMLAVFDGHGEDGHYVAEHFRDLIPDAVFSHKKFNEFLMIADNIAPPSTNMDEIDQLAEKVMKQNYKTSVLPSIGEPTLRRDVGGAIKGALLSVEKSLLARDDIDCNLSGCTGCIVVITGNYVTVANVGDSRAILVRTAPVNTAVSNIDTSSSLLRLVPAPLSIDHKPTMLSETKRILLAGGRVHAIKYDDGIEGPVRVWCKNEDVPGLAMSRSLGDVIGKRAGVSSIPDIFTYTLHDNDTFLVLASDGLWEFMSGLDITDIIGTTAAEAQLQLLAYTLAQQERSSSSLDTLETITEPVQHLQLALDTLAEASGTRWQTREGVIDDISIIMAELGRVPITAVRNNSTAGKN